MMPMFTRSDRTPEEILRGLEENAREVATWPAWRRVVFGLREG